MTCIYLQHFLDDSVDLFEILYPLVEQGLAILVDSLCDEPTADAAIPTVVWAVTFVVVDRARTGRAAASGIQGVNGTGDGHVHLEEYVADCKLRVRETTSCRRYNA